MKKLIALEDVLALNNVHYVGDCHETTVLGERLSFVKGFLKESSKCHFSHPLFNPTSIQSGCYIVREIEENKKYVGSAKDIYKRIYQHRTMIFTHKTHHNSQFRELLERTTRESNFANFEVIIFFTNDRDQAYNLEQHFIDTYADESTLLNVARDVRNSLECGSDSAYVKKRRKVTINGREYESISAAGLALSVSATVIKKSADFLEDKNNPLKGRRLSSELKKRISLIKKTDERAMLNWENIRYRSHKQIILNGERYESILDASKKLGIGYSLFRKRLSKLNFSEIVEESGAIVTRYHSDSIKNKS